MSRLLTIGVLSQASDPAKVLADAYYAYVIAQGATCDYTTVYNIYKDEYLTDSDKDKFIDWYDFRAGVKLSGTDILNVYSMIYPYRTNSSATSTKPILYNNEYISHPSASTNLAFPTIQYADYNGNLKVITKTEPILPLTDSRYLYLFYGDNQLGNNVVSFALRYINSAGNARLTFYCNTYEQNTYNNSSLTNHTGIQITRQEVDFTNNIHRGKSTSMPTELNILLGGNTSVNYVETSIMRIYALNETKIFWMKVYSI